VNKRLNLIIFLSGLIIFIINFIIGHLHCVTVGLILMLFSFINLRSYKIKNIIIKTFLFSFMFWMVRFASISIPVSLHFYHLFLTKFTIFLILLLFILKKFHQHPLKLSKFYIIIIFLLTNFILDLAITYRFDSTIFSQPFFYLTLLPILLI
jgi:hypothetical protein